MEAEGSRMAARKKAGGQTPEPTNRNHIGCSCGIKDGLTPVEIRSKTV